MWKLLGGAAEDLCKPLNSFLMRYVHEATVTEDIGQAVWGGVRLRNFLCRPKVPPPRDKRQHKRKREGDCYEPYCQRFSSHALTASNLGASEALFGES